MSAIKKDTAQLRGTATQLSGFGRRVTGIGTQLDAAVRPARRADVPELGQIDALYGGLRSRITNSGVTLGQTSRGLTGYADASERVEHLLDAFRHHFGDVKGSRSGKGGKGSSSSGRPGDPTTKVGVSQEKKEELENKRKRGQEADELDPFVGPVFTWGRDWPLFGDDVVLSEHSGSLLGVPTSSKTTAHYSGALFSTAKAGRVKDGYRGEARLGGKLEAGVRSESKIGNSKVNVHTGSSIKASAEASAGAAGQITKEGIRGGVGGKAGIEVSAGVDGGGKISGASAGGGIEAKAGLSAEASVDGALSLHKVGVDAKIGGSLGIGAGVHVKVEVDPVETYHDVKNVAGGAVKVVKKIDIDPPGRWSW